MRPSPVPEDRLLVLLYHNVGPSPGRAGLGAHWTQPPALRAQLRWLRAAGHTFVDAEWVVDWAAQGAEPHPLPPLPRGRGGFGVPRPTLLTFDDGLANLYTHALPILEQERVPALVFLVAGHVGGVTDWEAEPRWRGNRLLTWEQIREMQERGVTFGSHTLTHPRLPALPEAAWRRELAESKRLLEEGLGRPAATLAYPYGDFSPEIAQAALEAGYRACFSTIPGLNGPETDPAALRRMNVRRHAGLWQFRRKVGKMARLP
jgi:peptidoglycan/xylan/chitin deacetylase (PgdA/CDA1 family)